MDSKYTIEDLFESEQKLKFISPWSDNYKEMVDYHNSIVENLRMQGEFDCVDNYGHIKFWWEE